MDRIKLRLDLKAFRTEMDVQLLFGKGISFVKLTKYQTTFIINRPIHCSAELQRHHSIASE
jgi:hypothetical protein